MKDFIVNIYKTLFFFDLSIIVVYYLPDIKAKNPAYLQLGREAVFLGVMLLFTFVFLRFAEKGKLKFLNLKNILRHYSLGLLSGVVPIGLTVLLLWVFRALKFDGAQKTGNIIIWLLALLCNAVATELLLHGYLFKLYRKYYSIITVTVMLTLLYISLNISIFSKGKIYAANMLIFNIMLCLLTEYSYSLLAPITARFVFGILGNLLFGYYFVAEEYPVLLNVNISGKPLVTGGDSGIIGSAVMLIINILLCAFYIFRLKKRAE